MSNIILFVFEGEKTEPQIAKCIQDVFFAAEDQPIVQAIFGTDIYQLWLEINKDEDLDLVEVLREIKTNERNKTTLQNITRNSVSEIYLFFDYDGHATQASDEKIQALLQYFDEETEHGKLYISYPMVESLKDLDKNTPYQNKVVAAKQNTNYKNTVSNRTQYQHIKKLTRDCWQHIIHENICKGHFIVHGQYSVPKTRLEQSTIFEHQLTRFIKPHQHVAVLSSFPFFVVEYFGMDKIFKVDNTS